MHTRSVPYRGDVGGHRADWRRSLRLLRAFRVEQSDPDRFYRELAADSVSQVAQFAYLSGSVVLDVGGGPGYFADAFERHGARYVAVEADAKELTALGPPTTTAVMASGAALPFLADSFDVVYSSNVLEHVADRESMVAEMMRVARPGGIVFAAYTVWYGPWGGHETSPWHLLSGPWARRRYQSRHGHEPKNRFGETMFPVTVDEGLRLWATAPGADPIVAFPRYLPSRAWWLLKAHGLRELLTWNLALVWRVDG